MKKLPPALVALLLAGAATLSFAHGDDPKTHKPAAVTKEQKDWGIAGDAGSVTRTVNLTMDDNMRFTPDKLSFKQGETVRFVIRNKGKLLHELVIGTKKELDEHAAMMLKFPAMEHEEPYMAHVSAGKTGTLIWTFNRPGEFDFACLIAGHYQAGMVGKISVAAASR
ncbi:MAG: cupredoxin family protein [Polaromonas sp.]|nr:cupredoxin family protein [Polaromonas sp.]